MKTRELKTKWEIVSRTRTQTIFRNKKTGRIVIQEEYLFGCTTQGFTTVHDIIARRMNQIHRAIENTIWFGTPSPEIFFRGLLKGIPRNHPCERRFYKTSRRIKCA